MKNFIIVLMIQLFVMNFASADYVGQLIEGLGESDEKIRTWAMEELIEIGETILPELEPVLREGDAQSRFSALQIIATFGESTLPLLTMAIMDRDEKIRNLAMSSLQKLGAPVLIVNLLKAKEVKVRKNISYLIGELGEAMVETIPALIQLLNDEKIEVQISAIEALGKMGKHAQIAIPAMKKLFSTPLFGLDKKLVETLELEAPVFLFETVLTEQSRFEKNSIDQKSLRKIFSDNEILLSTNLRISTQIRGGKSTVIDGDRKQIYSIEKSSGKLKVYRLSISKSLMMALDENLLFLSASAKILPIERGKLWLIADRESIYRVRFENDKLIVHGDHSSEKLRATILASLGKIGTPRDAVVPFLVENFNDTSDMVARAAAIALRAIGTPNELIQLLDRTDNSRAKFYATMSLGDLDPPAMDAIPHLVEALSNDELRAVSAKALGKILSRENQSRYEIFDEELKLVVGKLKKVLQDNNFYNREAAVEALGKIGPPAAEVVPQLVEMMDDAILGVRTQAILALGKIGEASELAVPQLIILALTDPGSRAMAISVLGEIGEKASDAIPTLSSMLENPEQKVRMASVVALGKISPIELVREGRISQLLVKDESAKVRRATAEVLGKINTISTEIITVSLISSLGDLSEEVQKSASFSLVEIGKSAVPQLLISLRLPIDSRGEKNELLRRHVAFVLREISSPLEEIIPALFEISIDRRENYHGHMVEQLRSVDRRKLLHFLSSSLRKKDRDIRVHAAYLLGQLESPIDRIIEELGKAMGDGDGKVRLAAQRSLMNFKSEEAEKVIMDKKIENWKKRRKKSR